MQNNNKKINGSPDQNQDKPQRKNSQARINANNKYSKTHYKDVSMKVKPETAEYLRNTAKKYETSLTQLVIIAITEYDINHSDTTTTENRTDTADTVTASAPEDNAPDQQDTTTSNGSQIISRNTPSRNNSKSAGEAQ